MDWKTILERDGPTAWRAAYRILGNADDADDCLQDAALAAVQLSQREPVANWRALLTRLASSRAVDRLRKVYRNRVNDQAEDQIAAIPDPHEPSEAAQLNELRNQLRVALAHLSQDQVMAFCLCALEGWTYSDAAEQLGMPTNTIGVLVHRAREQLRQLLQRVDPNPVHTWNHP